MFDDFRRDETRARKRFARSIVISATLYAGGSAALIAASAEARQQVEEVLTQVQFVRPPPPPPPQPPPQVVELPPPEAPKPVQARKPRVKRPPLIAASAEARQQVEEVLTQVQFVRPAPPPPPPPPPPQPPPQVVELPPPEAPKPVQARKPRVKRPPLIAPQEVPTEKPQESDGELVEAPPPGPLDGALDGVEGGTGTAPVRQAAPPAPPPPPAPVKATPVAKLIAPVALKTERPRYPARLRRKGIEGTVVVAFDVLDDGKIANPKIVSGPPELHETVLETVMTWRFQPARRGAKTVRQRIQHTIRFRLEDG